MVAYGVEGIYIATLPVAAGTMKSRAAIVESLKILLKSDKMFP